MAGADIIVTTTPASEPILKAAWLWPGQHVTAMGSDAEHKNEIEPSIVARADLYVADRLSQTRRLGELHHAIAAGLVAADAEFAELGQIIAGQRHGPDIAGRHHHRRPDRHRRAGHGDRHAGARPRAGSRRRYIIRQLSMAARPKKDRGNNE